MPFLDWVNKAQATQVAAAVPYHLLEFQSAHGDGNAENLLIQGDNLLALKALLPYYRGQVKCIYIDPPYNTQSAFEHYDDKLEHSQWLSMMHPRLVLLRELLAEDGSIWVSIDDREAHYLKVLMDEVFGRRNFVSSVIWQKIYTVKNSARHLSEMHDHVLVYAKSLNSWQRNLLPRSDELNETFTNPDHDPKGAWTTNAVQARNFYSQGSFPITSPSGKVFYPPSGTFWRVSEENFKRLDSEGRVWWGKNGGAIPRIKRYLSEVKQGVVPATLWLHGDAGQNAEAKDETRTLADNGSIFDTPKPERLILRILHIATNPGDLVLDSFLGSGTTAAVAHKMGRRWIGIEMGDHAVTHCLPRLEKVGAGETGGISAAVGWQGGGGFRFHRLGEAVFDAKGGINPAVRFASLAAYLWHFETGRPAAQSFDSPCLGTHEDKAYYLLYNGILGDRRPAGGNVLTANVLAHLDELFPHAGPRVIYGETTRLGEARLREAGITFKQIPYDIKAG
jgi:adenine-specific DNA-methyltransferase